MPGSAALQGRAWATPSAFQQAEPAQPPDGGGGEEDEEEDTTSVFTPPPIFKSEPFDSTAAPVPARSLQQPGAARPDTMRAGDAFPDSILRGAAADDTTRGIEPQLTGPTRSVPSTGPGTATQGKPAVRRGIFGAHPAAIIFGLILAHVLIVRLITR